MEGDLVLPDSFSIHFYLTIVSVLGRSSLENEFSQQSKAVSGLQEGGKLRLLHCMPSLALSI